MRFRLQLLPHYLVPSGWPNVLLDCQSHTTMVKCRGARSLAYDLITSQGVVLGRAASILRSVET